MKILYAGIEMFSAHEQDPRMTVQMVILLAEKQQKAALVHRNTQEIVTPYICLFRVTGQV